MKRCFTRSGSRAVCLGLAALAVLCWSCTKEPAFDGAGPKAEGAIAQARSFYESTVTPLTRSVGEQQIPIKPLPGEMTPLWDKATASVLSDGTTTRVDVPIQGTITYTAVRGGHRHHNDGEECGHDHTPVQAVQKLSVYTASDGSRQSLIATIVPEPDCTVELNGFSSAEGLAGFSGFVSWHDLTGKLIRVAGYENGTKTRSVEATRENEEEVLEVVENAVLYPKEMGNNLCPMVTKSSDKKCIYCEKDNCKQKNQMAHHCMTCRQYDSYLEPFASQCVCARCTKCGLRYKGNLFINNTCTCGGKVNKITCTYCNKLLCNHILYGADYNSTGVPKWEVTIHETMLKEIFYDELSVGEFKYLKGGTDLIDRDYDYQNAGYEYLHGMYVPADNSSQGIALEKMRDHFIHQMKDFVHTKEMLSLGKGFHPILDTYLEVQVRKDMLNYYTYANLNNVVHGMNTAPYTSTPTSCTEAVHYIFDALKTLPTTATDAEVGAVFDGWVSMAQGAGKPGLLP